MSGEEPSVWQEVQGEEEAGEGAARWPAACSHHLWESHEGEERTQGEDTIIRC